MPQALRDTGRPAADAETFTDWQQRVAGTNISATTLLATDYLNHYNEAVMVVEMLPQMPEMLDDIADWQPVSYAEHFRTSGLADADLAIGAYAHVPAAFKHAFEETVSKLDRMMLYALETANVARAASSAQIAETCAALAEALKTLLRALNDIINGTAKTVSEAEINRILAR